jgi:curli biogenesis system outer membrane secretion channel CsgG
MRLFSTFIFAAWILIISATSAFSQTSTDASAVLKRKVAIARFSNETSYGKGMFYDKDNDPMAKQALDILSARLADSQKFILLERSDLSSVIEEIQMNGSTSQQTVGADYIIVGSITEFGRKNVGDVNLFSRSKTQIVEAAVSVRLIDVSTGQIIYSEEARGEAETSSNTVLGLGERADYDATLSDKAISAAISKLVENVVNNCMERPWKSFLLSAESDAILIAGGISQGLKEGTQLHVIERGRTVRNPQTGMNIELPGKQVGIISILMTGGDDPMNEYSIVQFVSGSIDTQNLDKYIIQEIR